MTRAVNRILAQNGSLVYIVTGIHDGKALWHCILLDKTMKDAFLASLADDSADLQQFGKILCSGWGETPPAETLETLAKEYMPN